MKSKWLSIFRRASPRLSLTDRLCSQATLLRSTPQGENEAGVLVISHDAHLAGAQRLLLNLLGEWKRTAPFPVKVICVGPGVLSEEFRALFPTLFLSDFDSAKERDAALIEFVSQPWRAIYSSTVVNGPLLAQLRALGVPIITHSHELQVSIERWASGAIMTTTLTYSDLMLGGSTAVVRNLQLRHQVPAERLGLVFDFIDFWPERRISEDDLRALRAEFSITPEDIVVFGCGTTDWRKGPDLFLEVALIACARDSRLKFIWIGGETNQPEFAARITTAGLSERIMFVGNRDLSRRYYYVGHIFALTSREDPCPLVALEAANAELPVVCYDGAGDIPNVLGADAGAIVQFERIDAFAESLLVLASNAERRRQAGQIGRAKVRAGHAAASAALAIERAIDRVADLPIKRLGLCGAPLVSVVVPHYNHGRFVAKRLASVAQQSLPELEIIVLDDASTDASLPLIQRFVAEEARATLEVNEINSGSTFKQWRKGLARAQGKYIWIAESDDFAHRDFLRQAVDRMESDAALMIFHAQSEMIGPDDRSLGRPHEWLDELAAGRWHTDFVAEGSTEVRDYLARKNTILNASAVLFRNFPGIESLVDDSMRLCADWLFWARLLLRGKYAFSARTLNFWRQNTSNARTRPPGLLEWDEGQKVLSEIAASLNFAPAHRARLLSEFRARCVTWSGGLLSN